MLRVSASHGRSSRTPILAAVALVLSLAALCSLPCPAQAAAPAKKDSPARARPKDVAVTATVSTTEAKPGDTIAYKVSARLQPGYHIYIYSKEDNEVGPKNTRFDLFDPAGLMIEGDWAASKIAITKKEPAFPELESVSFYEGEVTWSVPLKVPADAKAGKRTIRCQASYQICNAEKCSFPGRWTLPDVVVNVLPSDQTQVPPTPKPSKPDSRPAIVPRSIHVSASLTPQEARPGEVVKFQVTARLDPGWHVYDYAKTQPEAGPRVTTFDVFDLGGLKVMDDWASDVPPQVKKDPSFDQIEVSTFEGQVTWTLSLQVPPETAPGAKTIRLQFGCQLCDEKSCLPPARWTLAPVTLKVVKGGVGAIVPTRPETPPAGATAVKPAKTPKVVSEVERTAEQGIIPLMIASALGGLLALVMPCVWPMVPITVNFFVKQGQANKEKGGSTTGLAVTYCLAIIGVFTAVGVFCSFFLSATALPKLANNPWLNFGVAGLFFAFGLSLLGLFEVRLPNALLNASAKGEGRGGLIGVVFMALTLTITSFTCTFPVVGGLLVMASAGQFFYPIIGLATFSTVLALPFFLLALSPGLLSKVPKSGDWMNAVKVVGGLVEIGAAFKFLNTAELAFSTPDNAWIDAEFILTAWVVLAAVCGFYLLGFFRTDHDHAEVKVGPGRMVLGICFLGMALYLAPALFGRPPQSMMWERLVVGLLPPDVGKLSAGPAGGSTLAGGESHKKATSTDPAQAQREEKSFHGVWWGFSYEDALAKAKAEGKPVLIDFTGVNCANCRLMEARVLPRPEVVELLKKFVTVQLYTDFVPIDSITRNEREQLAEKNQEREYKLTNDYSNPFYVIVSPDETLLGARGGYREPQAFVAFLEDVLDKHKGAGKVVQAGSTP